MKDLNHKLRIDVMDKEPGFIGVPKRDWWPVLIFMIISGIVFIVCDLLLPTPYDVLAFAWIAIGQGLLTKYKAVKYPYPRTIMGSGLSFLMAALWPYFCYAKPSK